MQPKMCSKCKKNVAVVFITKVENGVTMNEGYCLKCARSLGIPQIDQAVKQMGISEEDLDMLTDEMSSMFGQRDDSDDADDDEIDSQTATFPLLNQQVNIQKAITKRFGQQHTYGALAGARKPRNHHEAFARNLHVNLLQVVHAGAFHFDAVVHAAARLGLQI